MAESSVNKKKIDPEEFKAKGLDEINTNKRTKFCFKRESDVDIENYSPQELDKAIQNFYVKTLRCVILSCQ